MTIETNRMYTTCCLSLSYSLQSEVQQVIRNNKEQVTRMLSEKDELTREIERYCVNFYHSGVGVIKTIYQCMQA